jgi:hypothetical protein
MQLQGASEQLSMFHTSMQHKARARPPACGCAAHLARRQIALRRRVLRLTPRLRVQEASLVQLMDEHHRLQQTMAEMAARAEADKAAHGHAMASSAAAEVQSARAEADMLRAALQRCFADYTTAVDSLSAAQQHAAAAQLGVQAAAHDAPAQHTGWWHRGGGAAQAAPHVVDRPQEQAWGAAHHEPLQPDAHGAQAHLQYRQASGHGGQYDAHAHHDAPLWADDAEAIRYANAMADRA